MTFLAIVVGAASMVASGFEPWSLCAFAGISMLMAIADRIERLCDIEDAYLQAAEDGS